MVSFVLFKWKAVILTSWGISNHDLKIWRFGELSRSSLAANARVCLLKSSHGGFFSRVYIMPVPCSEWANRDWGVRCVLPAHTPVSPLNFNFNTHSPVAEACGTSSPWNLVTFLSLLPSTVTVSSFFIGGVCVALWLGARRGALLDYHSYS